MAVTHVVSVIYILIRVKEGRLLPEVMLGKRGIDRGRKEVGRRIPMFSS